MTKKILLIISVITLLSACQKDFSVWKEYNDAELKKFEENLGKNSPDMDTVTEYWKSPTSGLLVEVFHRGQTGIVPKLSSYVFCKQSGYLVDGTRFEYCEPTLASGYLVGGNNIRAGLKEILCQMPMGSHFRIYVPYALAYGKEGSMGASTFYIPPYSVLIYDIEIVDVIQNNP